jgi:hypothetical protein
MTNISRLTLPKCFFDQRDIPTPNILINNIRYYNIITRPPAWRMYKEYCRVRELYFLPYINVFVISNPPQKSLL